jgi:hypothetical protein
MTYRVGVLGPGVFVGRPRLWGALEEAFPVRFEPRGRRRLGALDGVISHGVDVLSSPALPTLRSYAHDKKPGGARIRLTEAAALPECLRGASLGDERAAALPCVWPGRGETVLAERHGTPLWAVRRGGAPQHRCAALPEELGPSETLRDRFRAGRFIALLPMLAFLRELTEGHAWKRPALRAAFVFDDPSLHWPSYGYLDFADLAARASSSGFHVAFATVPLDAWYANRRVVDLLRGNPQLSLLMHGNEHARCELGRLEDEGAAIALAAEAVRRVAALERRTGLAVARVMAPPHGECSQVALRALRRAGLLAACISRPYPWLASAPPNRPLAQWDIADVVAGLPVLPRYPLGACREELPLRAFLGQPLILYGHHGDLAGGAELLDQVAGQVNRLGAVRWSDLASLARSSFLTRRDGDLLRVRMLAREIELELPAGVERVVLERPNGVGGLVGVTARHRSIAARPGEEVALLHGERGLHARLLAGDGVDVEEIPPPRRRLWPPARRLLAQGRDRLTPALSPRWS